MKNKKILNICLLTFALISLITFILPIKKFEALLGGSTAINIVFYVCSAILIISVSAIIVFAIINLFKDNYNFVLLMEALSLTSLIMVFITILLFACVHDFKISLGYILVSIEVFFLANFSQMARLFSRKQDLTITPNKIMGKPQKNNLSKKTDKQNFESYDSENKKENLEENKNDSEEKNA